MFVWTKSCDEVILIPFTVFQAPVTDHFIEAIDISSKLSVTFVDHWPWKIAELIMKWICLWFKPEQWDSIKSKQLYPFLNTSSNSCHRKRWFKMMYSSIEIFRSKFLFTTIQFQTFFKTSPNPMQILNELRFLWHSISSFLAWWHSSLRQVWII